MNLLIKLFGEKSADSCCAIEIKELKPTTQKACCQETDEPADDQAEPEAEQPKCC